VSVVRNAASEPAGPLSDIRILDLTRVVAGPYSTMLLGDLGADVIKVERPGTGDDCRGWGPPFRSGTSTYFLGLNRNKRSIAVDLATPAGVEIVRRIAAQSDVVVESFRPGVMDRLGLGYEELRAANDGLIYCAISAFGQSGPYRDQAGYDVMVSALGGLMSVTGTPGGQPVKVGVALLDVATGMNAALGVLAALHERAKTGKGQRIDTSLLATQLAILINAASGYLLAGEVLEPQGTAHASIVPYQAFAARDGWVMIGAANDKLFRGLAAALGQQHWADDPRFATNAARVAHRAELIPLIEAKIRNEGVDTWVRALSGAGVAVAPVNRIDQVFADEHVKAAGMVTSIDHPTAGALDVVAPAIQFSATPASVRVPPPELGEHTEAVLRELAHCDDADIERLLRACELPGSAPARTHRAGRQ
jgi:crotonobetainyl-CoA:carnitine CoA-transferase CaiB-like acyl-CoA transferase